jgi:hypothetical protein
MKMKCQKCEYERSEQYFYKGFTECRDCIKNYLDSQPLEKAFISAKELLEEANYLVNEELLLNIFFGGSEQYRGLKAGSMLGEYLKKINTMPQFEKYRYNQKSETKEKSDIYFINDDIKQLKKNIEKAIQNNDFNSHNKWMNCLRDALEIRDKLYIIEVSNITYKNAIAIGESLKGISKRIKCYDIAKKIGDIIDIPININDNVYDILKYISIAWDKLSEESQKEISKIIAGERDKETIKVIFDNLD